MAAADLILRSTADLKRLGVYIRARRRAAGLPVAKEAAPFMGVSFRLLVELEQGERRVTINKLLPVLEGLGLEMVIRPRAGVGARRPDA